MVEKKCPKILVADDHLIVRHMVAAFLRQELGARVEMASDGAEALQILRANRDIDVALLDISMPGKTGLQVLEEFQRERGGVQFVIISALESSIYEEKARRLGAYAFIPKEHLIEELVPCLRAMLAERAALSAAAED